LVVARATAAAADDCVVGRLYPTANYTASAASAAAAKVVVSRASSAASAADYDGIN
jgi:hypothetical protein